MAKLLEQINQDLKAAMKGKDAFGLSVLRMLISALRNKEISLRSPSADGGKAELTDEQAVEVIASEVKKRYDSIEAYTSGGRPELAAKEAGEIKILEKYLPAQLADDELEKIILEVVETHGNASVQTDFGRIMGQAMAKVKGRADGKKVGEIVKKLLAK
jgi:hypothetical protein